MRRPWAGGDAITALAQAGRALHRRARAPAALPPAFFVTDPARTPDPAAVMRRLPRGCGVIYRAFGAANAVTVGRRLMAIARSRGLVLLVGADARLAAAIGADGVHLPERLAHRARGLRRAHPGWLVSAAAHGAAPAIAARRSGAQAVLVSAVFPSASPSAGRALGVLRFAAIVRAAGLPAYALGGIDAKNAPRLLSTGASGLAAVDGFRT